MFKTPNNIRKNENKKEFVFKFSQNQGDNSSKSQKSKFIITYSKDSSSGERKSKEGK